MHTPHPHAPRHLWHTAAAGVAALLLAACGGSDNAGKEPAATQVAAKVGSEEISVYQINQVLNHAPARGASAEQVRQMGREVLEKLIDQQLAVDQALGAKLNRTPEVVWQLEASRREVLARAYLRQITGGLDKPTEQDIAAYYSKHPALFAERRVFRVQEVVVPMQAATAEPVRAFATPERTAAEFTTWLQGQGIAFGGGVSTRPAEQVPLEALPRLHALRDGQGLVLETPQALTLVRLLSSESAPVSQATAAPGIERYLANERAARAVSAQMRQLRESTSISYFGEFAEPPPAQAGAPAVATSAPPAASPVGPAAAALEKGIAGMR